jgi:uncharacterized protein (DUF433 family)
MSSITNINGHLVIGKLQVPVRNVTNYILSRYSLESIIQRLPINKQEVFECLDAIADHDSIQVNDRLVVVNQSTVEEDILLVTSIEDLNDLFDIGFRQLAIESFQDKVSGNGVLDESSDIHGIVSSAIEDAIPDLSIEKILTYLKNDT